MMDRKQIKISIRRGFAFMLVVMSAITLIMVHVSVPAQESVSPRHIYLVYDNSGSMQDTDAWKQAAYGVELLASMMEEGDTLSIYFMQEDSPDGNYYDIETYTADSSGADAVVTALHEKLQNLSYVRNTYKDCVFKAVNDIQSLDSGENVYLIVFSDGEFNTVGDTDTYGKATSLPNLTQIYSGLKSIYFALGDKASRDAVEATETLDTADGTGVLSKFAEIGNLIYDRQEVAFDSSDGSIGFSLDLPVSRLIVIAQTEDGGVSASRMYSDDGELSDMDSVSCTGIENTYNGIVNICESDSLIPSGDYSFYVPADAEILVYAEYEVQYMVSLTNAAGDEWILGDSDEAEGFREGDYTVKVSLMDALTGEALAESSLYDNMELDLELAAADGAEDSGDTVRLTDRVTGEVALAEGEFPGRD